MRGGRAGGLGTRPRRRLTPELPGQCWEEVEVCVEGEADPPQALESGLLQHAPTAAPRHSTNIQQPVTENDHKANLLPGGTVSAALRTSSKTHLYPHNEAVEHRAAGGRRKWWS